MVLNGKGDAYRISSTTQARVIGLADELNYAPNPSARNLRLQRSFVIGLVLSDFSNVFFSQLAKHLERYCRENGYLLQISDSNDDEKVEEDLIRGFVARSVDGLILATSHNDSAFLAEIAANTPTIFVDRRVEGDHCSWVTSDNYESTRRAVSLLVQAKPREIVYIGGLKGLSSSIERRSAYGDTLRAAGMPIRRSLILERDYTTEWGRQAMQKIRKKLGRNPDALFTASYTLLEGALTALRSESTLLPNDVLIATYDDHPLLNFIQPPIHSVEQDCEEIAHRCFSALERLIDDSSVVVRETVPAKLHVRGTEG
jgi:LacI family sucrose operon transcriptional repressor